MKNQRVSVVVVVVVIVQRNEERDRNGRHLYAKRERFFSLSGKFNGA
jgi:hypothetical protein